MKKSQIVFLEVWLFLHGILHKDIRVTLIRMNIVGFLKLKFKKTAGKKKTFQLYLNLVLICINGNAVKKITQFMEVY